MNTLNPFENVIWVDAFNLTLEGLPLRNLLESPYDRLPLRLKSKVRNAIWELGKMPTGGCVLFESNSSELFADWEIEGENFSNSGVTTGRGAQAGIGFIWIRSSWCLEMGGPGGVTLEIPPE